MNPEDKKKLIIDIFNEMDFEENINLSDPGSSNYNSNNSGEISTKFSNELPKIITITKEPKLLANAVESAKKGHNKWKSLSALQRATFMHKVWKFFKKTSMSLSELKNEFLILADYFDFNADLAAQIAEYKSWKPQGIVLIILSSYSPFFLLGATVAPALATGCSVIMVTPENIQIAALVLEEVFAELGLPEGLLNVVTDDNNLNISELKKIDKVFFCGSYSAATTFYVECPVKSFNFFSPNNTAALILDSSDLSAAANKIVAETWGKNYFFGVSNAVVQESIFTNFLEKLKFRLEQFMSENKNSLKFKDDNTAEKIKNIILKATKAGALVEKSTQYDNKWSPTILVNYQSQDNFEDVPVLRILSCRSAKEGIILLNNTKCSLGTSVWSEHSSQALEVSSMLNYPNIWINCHGMVDASEPIQLSDISGNCALGGSDGILEYLSFRNSDTFEGGKTSEGQEYTVDKVKILQTALTAHQAFNSWQNNRSRRQHLKDLANILQEHKELSKLSEIVSNYAHLANVINSSEKNGIHKFVTVKWKVPVGVILFVLNSPIVDLKALVSLITPAIALGNAVIFLQNEENPSVEVMIRYFSNSLPRYLVSIVFGQEAMIHLTSDPNVQAIWIYDETAVSPEFLKKIKTHAGCLKRIWIIPKKITFSQLLFQKRCLKNKVIWQTKIDQFP